MTQVTNEIELAHLVMCKLEFDFISESFKSCCTGYLPGSGRLRSRWPRSLRAPSPSSTATPTAATATAWPGPSPRAATSSKCLMRRDRGEGVSWQFLSNTQLIGWEIILVHGCNCRVVTNFFQYALPGPSPCRTLRPSRGPSATSASS